MSSAPAAAPQAVASVVRLYSAKAAEELRSAQSLLPGADAVPDTGEPGARVLLVKGQAGPAEASGLAALSGPDGDAVRSALEALGFDPASVYAMLSRPAGASSDDAVAVARRVRATVEAVDPYAVVALDPVAGMDLSAAFGDAALTPGNALRVFGRSLLALDGLEASLSDPALKRRVWEQFRALKPPAPLW